MEDMNWWAEVVKESPWFGLVIFALWWLFRRDGLVTKMSEKHFETIDRLVSVSEEQKNCLRKISDNSDMTSESLNKHSEHISEMCNEMKYLQKQSSDIKTLLEGK